MRTKRIQFRDKNGRFAKKHFVGVDKKDFKPKRNEFLDRVYTIFAILALLMIGAAIRDYNVSRQSLNAVEASEIVQVVSYPSEVEIEPEIEAETPEMRIEDNIIIPPHTGKYENSAQAQYDLKKEETCELGFQSNNDGWIEPNELTLEKIQSILDCQSRKILTRLSHYETTQGNSALFVPGTMCNSLGYCGIFQIGEPAWDDCKNLYGITDEAQCALKHFQINAIGRFEAVERNLNSFTEFFK